MYRKLYYALFNDVTDALSALEAKKYEQAARLLRQAQRDAEERYLIATDGETSDALEGIPSSPPLDIFSPR